MDAPVSPRIIVNAINDNAELRGPDRYLLELQTEMSRAAPNVQFIFACAPWQSELIKAEVGQNVRKVVLTPPRNRWLRVFWQALAFPRWAAQQSASLVFMPNVILIAPLRTPCVMTVHDMAHFRFPEKFGRFKGRLQRIQIRLALRMADRLIAVSEFTRADMARFCPGSDKRAVLIEEGGPTPIARRHSPADPPFLLYVGRVERSKNVEALVEAFGRSRALKDLNVRLKIVGSQGNAESRVGALIARYDDGRIDRLGFVSEPELEKLYLTALGFVFPSLVEGFGLVLLEAMAHGAPVIAMNATAVPGVVGEAAILVDPQSANGLQEAMEHLAADRRLREDLAQRGYERLNSFSWQAAAKRTLAVFREAMK